MKRRTIASLISVAIVVSLVFTWKTIAFQVMLTASSLRHPETRDCAKQFFERIIVNDAPTAEWLASVDDWGRIGNKTNYFYGLKVHFADCGTSVSDIRRARIWVFQDTPTEAIGNFYYQSDAPLLQMTFLKSEQDDWKVRAVFPLNNCLFDPDRNDDGKLDLEDVETARKSRNEHPQG